MAEVGWDLWMSSSPTLVLLKQGYLENVGHDHAQMAFEDLLGRRCHSLSGQLLPVLSHPQNKKPFPDVQTESPVLQFVPVASCSVMVSPQAFSFLRVSSPSSLSLSL